MIDRNTLRSNIYMAHASLEAALSTCISIRVGSVAVKDKKIIATGYNGVPSGIDHCCDVHSEHPGSDAHAKFAEENEIHSEMNLILNALDRGVSLRGSVVYVTHSPCHNCLKHLKGANVEKVIYQTVYWRTTEEAIIESANRLKIIVEKL